MQNPTLKITEEIPIIKILLDLNYIIYLNDIN